jgi:hypothetical protein
VQPWHACINSIKLVHSFVLYSMWADCGVMHATIAGDLPHQLIPFLESIASAPDVRPLVRAEFKLHERVAASS